MVPVATIERFRADLDLLVDPGTRVGVAVSGGPDSMALLLLAAAARTGEIEAATVDHCLRDGSRAEAEIVVATCASLAVPHEILPIDWAIPPTTAIQEQARHARYEALAAWMQSRKLKILLTAHHLDDQAETVLMRLNRGSGPKGLAGMRKVSPLPGSPDLKLLRPLLQWRRRDLESVCAGGGVRPASDPSNDDERYERIRIRQAIAEATWLDAEAIARSAENLASSEEAIAWATDREWAENVAVAKDGITYGRNGAPLEIVRRIVGRAIAELGSEGDPGELRGRELSRLIDDLRAGQITTLRGVHCRGGETWHFAPATPRKK